MLRKSILIGLFVVNPLTPVPAVTGHAKMHPQLPVLAVTGREKCEDNCLSYMYPPWRDFGPPIVLLLLGQISQWEWTFWVYFWGTLGVLERGFFCLKITRLKSLPNLQTSRVLFSFLKRTNYFFALKMERENIKRCFGGLRMEDKLERNPQTFLVNNFSFLQPWWKHNWCTFKLVLNTDWRFKAAAWTLENGNVQLVEVSF